MQQKRPASVPIFNRGKRPRQALLSHPNNNVVVGDGSGVGGGGGGLQRQKQQPDARWSSQCSGGQNKPPPQPSYFESGYNRPLPSQAKNSGFTQRQTSSSESNSSFQTHHNKENHQSYAPRHGTWSDNNSFSSSHHVAGQQSSRHHHHNHIPVNNQQSSFTTNKPAGRGGGFTPHFPSNNKRPQGNSGGRRQGPLPGSSFQQQTGGPRGVSQTERNVASFPPGRAVEPTLHHHHSAKVEPSRPAGQAKQGHLPRVLTATARGVSHWSKFKTHVAMLFEVVGVLDSAVVSGPLGSREFSLHAADGTLRCLYWEIDTTLPHLIRGQPVRVVGGWDEKEGWFKCHSVREARDEEVKTTSDLVTMSDTAIRQTVTMMHEI